MRRYVRLVLHFLSLSWMQAMEYRVDYIMWSLIDMGWTAMDFVFFTVLVSNTQVIGNWDLPETMVVVGLFRLLVVFVWAWMFQSFKLIPEMISEGKLDMILVRPISSQFLVSIRNFSFSFLPTIVGGLLFICLGLNRMGRIPSFFEIIAFVWFTIVSVILMYGLYFSSVALSLYFDRLANIDHVFPSLYDAARYPKEIYSVLMQRLVTTIVPVALILAIPAESLFGRIEWLWVIWFHLLAFIFFISGKHI